MLQAKAGLKSREGSSVASPSPSPSPTIVSNLSQTKQAQRQGHRGQRTAQGCCPLHKHDLCSLAGIHALVLALALALALALDHAGLL